jgi:hypothetical protein
VQFILVQDTQSTTDRRYLDDQQTAGIARRRQFPTVHRSQAELVLPPADTKRWSSRRKAAVVVATRSGIISREEACERYLLSHEELAGWETAFDKRGIPGLRVASIQTYRTPTPTAR